MLISLIFAHDRHFGIGYQGKLPWRQSSDLKRFKALTLGRHIIMGRKTWESIKKALPGRRSIVITRQPGYTAPGADVSGSLKEALDLAHQRGESECFIIGGAQVYAQAMPLAHRIYATLVETDGPADTYIQPYAGQGWQLVSSLAPEQAAGDEHPFKFLEYHAIQRDAP